MQDMKPPAPTRKIMIGGGGDEGDDDEEKEEAEGEEEDGESNVQDLMPRTDIRYFFLLCKHQCLSA